MLPPGIPRTQRPLPRRWFRTLQVVQHESNAPSPFKGWRSEPREVALHSDACLEENGRSRNRQAEVELRMQAHEMSPHRLNRLWTGLARMLDGVCVGAQLPIAGGRRIGEQMRAQLAVGRPTARRRRHVAMHWAVQTRQVGAATETTFRWAVFAASHTACSSSTWRAS